MDKSRLLDKSGADKEDRLLLAKVLDRADQAQNRSIPAYTDFLSPQQQMLAQDLLRMAGIPESSWVRQGGYQGAERAIFLFLPDWMDPEDAMTPLCCLRASYREEISHRDLLGSLMGLGIVREKVGDILVGPSSADLVVLDTVADYLRQNWFTAGRARLRLTDVEPGCLHIPEVKCLEIRDTVSSLRLDAVVASGFRMARGKAAALIESGNVQVNWRECVKPDRPLAMGDKVSARGFGKFEVAEVGGITRKGRLPILLKRYV